MSKFKLFTFNSTHQALLMEKTLKDMAYSIRLIPVPRSLSASCGLAARVYISDIEAVNEVVEIQGIGIAGIYDWE